VLGELSAMSQRTLVAAGERSLTHRLGEPRDHDDAGASEIVSVTFENTEQSVVLAVGAADANFVETGHLVVHDFPLPAPGECGRWCLGNRVEHGVHLRANLERQTFEEINRRD